MSVLKLILVLLRSMLGSRLALAAENLALRQQLALLRRSVNRQVPSYAIGPTDAFFGMAKRKDGYELEEPVDSGRVFPIAPLKEAEEDA